MQQGKSLRVFTPGSHLLPPCPGEMLQLTLSCSLGDNGHIFGTFYKQYVMAGNSELLERDETRANEQGTEAGVVGWESTSFPVRTPTGCSCIALSLDQGLKPKFLLKWKTRSTSYPKTCRIMLPYVISGPINQMCQPTGEEITPDTHLQACPTPGRRWVLLSRTHHSPFP